MMRKYVLILIALLCNYTYSQNSLNLKFTYKPDMKYNISMVQKSKNIIVYSGDKETLKEIASQGVENPTTTENTITLNGNLKCGRLENKKFPIEIFYNKAESSEGKEIIPKGTTIYGACEIDSLPKFDSIVSKNMTKDAKKGILEVVKSGFSQIKLPNKKINIGEEITTEDPLSIPLGANKLDMIIVTKYKLISIKNNLGNFDIIQDIKFTTKIEDTTMNASGKGNGKLIYDIENNIFSEFTTNYEMKLNFKVKGITLNLTSNTEQNVKTSIIN